MGVAGILFTTDVNRNLPRRKTLDYENERMRIDMRTLDFIILASVSTTPCGLVGQSYVFKLLPLLIQLAMIILVAWNEHKRRTSARCY